MINWWAVLNKLLEGFTWGAGFSLAFVLCLVVVPAIVKRMAIS